MNTMSPIVRRACLVLALLAPPLAAQEPAFSPDDIYARLDAQEAEIRRLRAQIEPPQDELLGGPDDATAAQFASLGRVQEEKKDKPAAKPDDGWIDVSTEKWTV